jgi:hypothetical protein
MLPIVRGRLIQARLDHPDARTRQYKAAVARVYNTTIDELVEINYNLHEKHKEVEQENKTLTARVSNLKRDKTDPEHTCSICMEHMYGRVSLMCGHEMCPDCFAQHSRVNNKCPFCRASFAPKPKIPSKMPDQVLENMADVWGDDVESKGYFSEKLLAITSNKSFYDQEEYLKWLVVANGKILMNKIRMWYDVNIP